MALPAGMVTRSADSILSSTPTFSAFYAKESTPPLNALVGADPALPLYLAPSQGACCDCSAPVGLGRKQGCLTCATAADSWFWVLSAISLSLAGSVTWATDDVVLAAVRVLGLSNRQAQSLARNTTILRHRGHQLLYPSAALPPLTDAADELFVAVAPSRPGAQAAVSFRGTRALLDSDLTLPQAVAAYSQGTAPFAWYPPPAASPTRPSVTPTLLPPDAPPATGQAAAPAPTGQAAAAAATPAATSQATAEGAQNQAATAAERQIRYLLNRVASLEADRAPAPQPAPSAQGRPSALSASGPPSLPRSRLETLSSPEVTTAPLQVQGPRHAARSLHPEGPLHDAWHAPRSGGDQPQPAMGQEPRRWPCPRSHCTSDVRAAAACLHSATLGPTLLRAQRQLPSANAIMLCEPRSGVGPTLKAHFPSYDEKVALAAVENCNDPYSIAHAIERSEARLHQTLLEVTEADPPDSLALQLLYPILAAPRLGVDYILQRMRDSGLTPAVFGSTVAKLQYKTVESLIFEQYHAALTGHLDTNSAAWWRNVPLPQAVPPVPAPPSALTQPPVVRAPSPPRRRRSISPRPRRRPRSPSPDRRRQRSPPRQARRRSRSPQRSARARTPSRRARSRSPARARQEPNRGLQLCINFRGGAAAAVPCAVPDGGPCTRVHFCVTCDKRVPAAEAGQHRH